MNTKKTIVKASTFFASLLSLLYLASPVAFASTAGTASSTADSVSSTTDSVSSAADSVSSAADSVSSTTDNVSSTTDNVSSTSEDLTSSASVSVTTTGVPDPTFAAIEAKYQKDPITNNSSWFGFARQQGRDVVLTFPKQVDVHHIQITMRQDAKMGIYLPDYVRFDVKEGQDWYTVSKQTPSIAQNNSTDESETFTFNSKTGVEAGAVRISFPVAVFVFAKGLSVQGNTTDTGHYVAWNKNTLVEPPRYQTHALSQMYGNNHGINNMLLVYTGAYGSQGTWTERDFTPMVGYVNYFGYINSALFDTVLFAPYSKVPETVTGLTAYLDDLFAPNQQLSALNTAVGKINRMGTLYRPGYKEKVVLTIPYFAPDGHDFGTVNGQDIQFSPTPSDVNAISSRSAALNWYLQQLLDRWHKANFQHLQLAGLYWQDEQIHVTDAGEIQLLNQAEHVGEMNSLPILWIPFYGANDETKWRSLGFGASWIQPNFIEQGAGAKVSRIEDAMSAATRGQMGIEVELTSLKPSDGQLYQTFLRKLSDTQFAGINVSHAYYAGSKLLVTAAESNNPQQRAIYDETAQFIYGSPLLK